MRGLTLFATAIPVLALTIASFADLPTKLVYNGSESAPLGFYWLDDRPAKRGDFVLVRVPERVRSLIETRHYLPPDVPLIKRIVAVGGDQVCRKKQEILIDGLTVAVARIADLQGRPMPDWQGCRVLTRRRVFLLQPHPDSFDSRYFGAVDRSLIIGRVRRLRLPWRKHDPQ